ncbi:MAG: hypothetical protein WA183_01630 [Chthoniobacterales bacterium]
MHPAESGALLAFARNTVLQQHSSGASGREPVTNLCAFQIDGQKPIVADIGSGASRISRTALTPVEMVSHARVSAFHERASEIFSESLDSMAFQAIWRLRSITSVAPTSTFFGSQPRTAKVPPIS